MVRVLFICWLFLVARADPSAAAELRVQAAASLYDLLREVAPHFEEQSGHRLRINFAASGLLARQIQQGAPADLFFSADQERMDLLEKAALLLPGTRRDCLTNQLVVVIREQSALQLHAAADLCQQGVQRIALGQPASVPAGFYAREWLRQESLWEELKSRIIPTENVRAALVAVESGHVQAAVVYQSDLRAARRARVAFEVTGPNAPLIVYPLAILRRSKEQPAARAFLRFTEGTLFRTAARDHGFGVLP